MALATNKWLGTEEDIRSPEAAATGIETVTPSDSAELGTISRALYVGVTGNVAVVMMDGTSGILVAVPAATMLPIRVRQVKATGTTATSIVSLY